MSISRVLALIGGILTRIKMLNSFIRKLVV